MNNENNEAFTSVFRAAYKKCFGVALKESLAETESKHFSNVLFEETGLVIGAKTLKNYSVYIINQPEAKQQNPSFATLDTLARYVFNAPYTDEVKRKDTEAHYPYWYQYKNTLAVTEERDIKPALIVKRRPLKRLLFMSIIIFAVIILFAVVQLSYSKSVISFSDNFHNLSEDSMIKRGWIIKSKDMEWWKKRNEKPACLTLFTLRGDNWPNTVNAPDIKNLLLRKVLADCFTTEIHLDQFIPKTDWQQAGILLMEDSLLTGKTVRLSLAYNDYFGGFSRPKEIIIQGISSGEAVNNPEEIAHIPVFSIEQGQDTLVDKNLEYSALRIEKKGNHFRFLYSTSPVENFAFKEAFSKDLSIEPKYIGIFALQGFVNNTNYSPVHITFFNIADLRCK